jgi:hypothetical protein
MTGATLRIEPVEGRRAMGTFLRMPAALYGDDRHWIAPLEFEMRERLNPRKAPFFQHGEAALWLAWRGTACVGRISAQINRAHLARHGDATGQFGLLEAADDAAVFEALLGTAAEWLRARRMRRVRGPFSLSINEESGLLIDGFDSPPFVMMGHARPYYAPRLEEQGFAKAKDLVAYRYDLAEPPARSAMKLVERVEAMAAIRFRPLDWARFDAELACIVDIFNDAWSDNWGFVAMSPAEIAHLAKSLKPIIDARNVWFAEIDGETAAMAVTIPNINEAIRDMGGRLLPFNWAKLAWRVKRRTITSARMPLMGVRKAHHNTMVGSALALGVIRGIYDYHLSLGVREMEFSWVLEDNRSTRRLIETLGGRVYKRYRIYEKALA